MADITGTKYNTTNNNKFKILTINVNDLNQSNKRVKIFNYLKSNKTDITLLQETHSTNESEKKWQKEWPGMSFWHTGPLTNGQGKQSFLQNFFEGKFNIYKKMSLGGFFLLFLV